MVLAGLITWLWLLPSAAAAFPLSNCTIQLTSVDASGGTVDTAASGDGSASQSDPFIVDWDGSIKWTGSTSVSLKDNRFQISVFGIPTPLGGTNDNGEDNRTGSGTVGVSANAPFRITGLYYVSGTITGSGGSCEGSGVFKLAGDPLGTVPFVAGLALLVVGGLLLAAAFGGSLVAGVLGGLVAGLGLAVMLVIYSALLVGQATPLLAIVLLLVVGIVLALARGAMRRGASTPAL